MSAQLADRLDELLLLRAFANAHRRYQVHLDALRVRALEAGAIVQDGELLERKAECDQVFAVWERKFGAKAAPADPDRARAAGAV